MNNTHLDGFGISDMATQVLAYDNSDRPCKWSKVGAEVRRAKVEFGHRFQVVRKARRGLDKRSVPVTGVAALWRLAQDT